MWIFAGQIGGFGFAGSGLVLSGSGFSVVVFVAEGRLLFPIVAGFVVSLSVQVLIIGISISERDQCGVYTWKSLSYVGLIDDVSIAGSSILSY